MMIKNIITLFKKSTILKAITIVSGGTILAQILNFFLQPVITRLFTVEQFGEFAVFTAIISILSVVVTLAFDQAVVAAESDDEAQQLLAGAIYISILLSFIIWLVILLNKQLFLHWLKLNECNWLNAIPIQTLFMATSSAIMGYCYKKDAYKGIGLAAIVRVAALNIFQILLYYLKLGTQGLIVGNMLGILACIIWLLHISIKFINKVNLLPTKVFETMRKYYKFPLYQLPTSFINHFMDSAITYGILLLYTKTELGLYSLVLRIMALPLSLISGSLRQMCISQFSKNILNVNDNRKLFLKLLLILSALLTLPFFVLGLFGESICTFVFGTQWAGSGIYIQVLIPVYYIRSIVYPLSGVAVSCKKQQILLVFQVLLIVGIILSVFAASAYCMPINQYLFIQSLILSVIYIMQGFACYNVIGRKNKK